MSLLPRPHPQKHAERHGVLAINWVEQRRLGINRYVCTQAQLKSCGLSNVPRAPEGERPNAKAALQRRIQGWKELFGKQLVFIHELHAGERVVLAHELEHRFQDEAILHGALEQLVVAAPDE